MCKKDDLIKLCDELENCKNKSCNKNEIILAKKILREYINNDKNNILKLKAQIKIYNENKFSFFDELMKFVSVLTFIITILYNVLDKNAYLIYVFVALLFLFIIDIIFIFMNPIKSKREKWRKYIELALNEIEKDYK